MAFPVQAGVASWSSLETRMQSTNVTDEPRLAQKWLLRTLGGPKVALGWPKSGPGLLVGAPMLCRWFVVA